MIFSKSAIAIATVSLLAAAPAFAQSAGTSLGGTSNGVQGTPGQPSPSTTGTPMKGANTMMKSGNGTMTKAPMANDKSMENGAATGAMPSKN